MIERSYYPTPFGTYCVVCDSEAVTYLKRVSDAPQDGGERTPLSDAAIAQLMEYFEGKRQTFDIPLRLEGTPFQQRVWAALQAIPYGERRSYKQIAEAVGNPKASRAVGMANNRNPITIIVPCHRVVGANGKMVGYASGVEIKERLLALETEHK